MAFKHAYLTDGAATTTEARALPPQQVTPCPVMAIHIYPLTHPLTNQIWPQPWDLRHTLSTPFSPTIASPPSPTIALSSQPL